jgi:hypothetical protein
MENKYYYGKHAPRHYGATEEEKSGPAFAIIAMVLFSVWMLQQGIEAAGGAK